LRNTFSARRIVNVDGLPRQGDIVPAHRIGYLGMVRPTYDVVVGLGHSIPCQDRTLDGFAAFNGEAVVSLEVLRDRKKGE
jgi:hypothetical protein